MQVKGKYTKADVTQRYSMYCQPATSAQDALCLRSNDTSTDISYPSSRYTPVKNLGDGSTSIIFKGIDNVSNKEVIIKKISKKESWRKELAVLQKVGKLSSERLLKYIDFYESHNFSYIVTEFYDGFDLYEHIDLNVPYTESKALKICLEMAKCIEECHNNGIIHLDIKCENFMVSSNKIFDENGKSNIILIDFGHSEIIPSNESIATLRKGYNYGTEYYVCPEGNYDKFYSSKSDIWSLGVCLSLLLTGEYPYTGKDDDYYDNAMSDNIVLSKRLTPEITNILQGSLFNDYRRRPDITSFIRELNTILMYIDA